MSEEATILEPMPPKQLPAPVDKPDLAALRGAQENLVDQTTALNKQAKKVQLAAWELEQATLFQEPEFEQAFLDPISEVRKRYTGRNLEHIEYRRNTAVYMLRIGVPKEHICKLLHVNSRVIDALNLQLAASVAGFTDDYSEGLIRLSGEFFAAARMKIHEANALQAATAGGIIADKAIAIKSLSSGMPAPKDAIDVESANGEQAAVLQRKIEEARAKLATNPK